MLESVSTGEATERAQPPKGVLQRGILVLRSFVGAPDEMTLAEVSERTGLDKSTAHRLLKVLTDENFVAQDPDTRRYRLHTGVLELARIVLDQVWLPDQARTALTRLRDQTGESAGLHVKSGNRRLCVEEIESRSPLKMSSGVGTLYPLCSGAPGKLLVAHLDEEARQGVFADRDALGPWADKQRLLLSELAMIVQQGWASSAEETTSDARAVAAPVRDYRGQVVAAINIAAPAARLPDDRIPEVAELVVAQAQALSQGMGWTAGT